MIRDAPTSGRTPTGCCRTSSRTLPRRRARRAGVAAPSRSPSTIRMLELNGEPVAAAIYDRRSTDLSWCERIHLRQDLDRVLLSLPQHLQDCCHWLATSSVTEAALRSGLARGSIYSRIATLKRAFAGAGLDAYLASPRPTLSDLCPVSDQGEHEHPGRVFAVIQHPLLGESRDRFAPRTASGPGCFSPDATWSPTPKRSNRFMAYPFEPDRFAAAEAGDGAAAPPTRRLPIISADERLAEPRTHQGRAARHHRHRQDLAAQDPG